MKNWVMIPLLCLFSSQIQADAGLDILLQQKSKDQLNEKILKYQKDLDLSNSYLVQAYGNYRALGLSSPSERLVFDSFFAGSYVETLSLIRNLKLEGRSQALLDSIELYSLWKVELYHHYFKKWIDVSKKYDFSKTEVGFALDQVLGDKTSKKLLDIGFFVNEKIQKEIESISDQKLYTNFSLFAYSHLKKGTQGVEALLRLKSNDPLIFPLARTIVVDYAGKGQLGDAAKILSKYMNPIIEKSSHTEKISRFYLLMGRLLYQAKAYDASWQYYSSIPDESMYYLSAQTEKMWISLVRSDYSRMLGSYQTMKWSEMALKSYNPDIYVLGAMANLRLCHFSDVKDAFTKYVEVNKKFANRIQENLNSKKPAQIDENHFYINQLAIGKRVIKLEQERAYILLGRESQIASMLDSDKMANDIKNHIRSEIKNEWENRKKLLEQSLRRMRFAKIEFLSTLRRYRNKLASTTSGVDRVTTATSAIDKDEMVVFPYDGVIFGDELFNYYSKVEVLCKQGQI